MAKAKTIFVCGSCGFETPRWLGRCPTCESWNSFSETAPVVRPLREGARRASAVAPIRLRDVAIETTARATTGIGEFDRVLGGGFVPGSLTLIAGPPGIGKSTLLLQVAETLARDDRGPVVYVCGEESAAQIKLRAQRLGVGDDVLAFAETNLRAVLDGLETIRPRLAIVDSIQTVWLPEVESFAGSVAQVRDGAQALMEFAKRSGCATVLVGHVTKDGSIAGPRLLEHLVDTVIAFEGDDAGDYRIVRATKNRFGNADEIGVFTMSASGLVEVPNPSAVFLGGGPRARPSGSCVVASVVGSRPVLVEVQALVGETAYGNPRRLAANLDPARLAMILAVLERRAGLQLGAYDVYASVAGGLRVNEPAADLGIALAIASAFRGAPLAQGSVAYGEIGLSGELRRVADDTRRASEAQRLGFTELFTPQRFRDVGTAVREALA